MTSTLPRAGDLPLVATCPVGVEPLLAGELRDLGSVEVGEGRGAVTWRGPWADAWRANWRLRTANRVLVELGSWPAPDDARLARGAEALVTGGDEWGGVPAGELFAPGRTLSVRATSDRSRLRDTRWIALKVKDGIVDGQRRRFGRRSSVGRESADLPLRVRLSRDRASLFLDTSADPLDRRGYRVDKGAAPLRENLAAACILAAGWDGRGSVVDPMCGSGTLLAEAGAVALGLAPGRLRSSWAFTGFPGFDGRAWEAIRREPLPRPGPDVALWGLDEAPAEVDAARANLARAGLADRARLAVGDAFSWDPPEGPGLVAVNPPYGERLAASPEQWRRLGDLLKQRYPGWRAVVLAGGEGLGKHIGLRPERRLPVRNGPLEARILVFELY